MSDIEQKPVARARELIEKRRTLRDAPARTWTDIELIALECEETFREISERLVAIFAENACGTQLAQRAGSWTL